jgi:hypothetical protein
MRFAPFPLVQDRSSVVVVGFEITSAVAELVGSAADVVTLPVPGVVIL